MKTKVFGVLMICAMVMCSTAGWNAARCDEMESGKEVSAPIVKAAVFKNGYAFISRTFDAGPEGGKYFITDIPQMVHGTFWIESVNGADVRIAEKKESSSFTSPDFSSKSWLGKRATVLMENHDEITGSIVMLMPSEDGKYLILETENGVEILDFKSVRRVQIHSKKDSFTHTAVNVSTRMVLEFTVAPAKKKQIVTFSYLIKGLYWAPAYRLELTGAEDGFLTMETVVKNELMPIDQAVFELVSGFPNIQLKDVISPMTPGTKWDQFLSELSKDPNRTSENYGGSGSITAQYAYNASMADFDTAFEPPESGMESEVGGFDLQYQNIGRQSFSYGEVKSMKLGESKVKIRRIVEWTIPDNTDPNGYLYWSSRYQNNGNTPKLQDDVWDTIHFLNPFNFAMTTAPMTFFQDGKFVSQSQSFWTAPGQEVLVRVNKALNFKVHHNENEIEETRERVTIYDNTYWKAKFQGNVRVKNNRPETQHIVIKRNFSGKLLKAEGDPEKTLLFQGRNMLNARNQLKWIVDLKPGEEFTYQYEYEALW